MLQVRGRHLPVVVLWIFAYHVGELQCNNSMSMESRKKVYSLNIPEREARHVEPSSDGDPMHDHWP